MRRLLAPAVLAAAAPAFAGLLDRYGAPAVFLFVAVENFGVPIPGETMLVAASAYAAAGHLNIVLVVVLCIVGVWLGATLSYLAGRRGGLALLHRLPVPARHLERAQAHMARWGGHTVLLGRYVAFLRSYIGWLAGLNDMPLVPFLLWNLAGAVIWTLTFATLGYLLGHNWALVERIFKALGYGGVALVVLGVVGYLIYKRRRDARADDRARQMAAAGAEPGADHATGHGAESPAGQATGDGAIRPAGQATGGGAEAPAGKSSGGTHEQTLSGSKK